MVGVSRINGGIIPIKRVCCWCCVAILALLWSNLSRAASATIEMHIPDRLLANDMKAAIQIQNGEASMSLPKLRVFTGRGLAIYENDNFTTANALQQALAEALQRSQLLDEAPDLDTLLKQARTEKNERYQPRSLAAADFIFVEYWATGCPACAGQHKALLAFIKAHPHLAITLVHLETDILRAMRKAGAKIRHP